MPEKLLMRNPSAYSHSVRAARFQLMKDVDQRVGVVACACGEHDAPLVRLVLRILVQTARAHLCARADHVVDACTAIFALRHPRSA